MAGKAKESLISVTTDEYAKILERCFRVRQPLFVKGGPGIGKSAIPRQLFQRIAKERGLQYIEWSDLSLEQKKEACENPDKYFAFYDARTSQMDTTSLQGVPNMNHTEMLENIPYSWVIYFIQKNAHGALFFDEINLAAPIVQSITYSAIHDRVISDRRLGEDVFVFAAGNRQQDKAHTFDMPLPLRDRFAEVEVRHDPDQWVSWAIANKINPHLISFIRWKPSRLYKIDENVNDKPSTPRGVHRASTLLGEMDILSDDAHAMVSISCGSAFATEFQSYTNCYKLLNWDHLLRDPKKATANGLKLDQQFAVSGGIVERFMREPKDKTLFKKLIELAECLQEDFTINTFRMMRDSVEGQFGKMLQELGMGPTFAKKYGKLVLGAGR